MLFLFLFSFVSCPSSVFCQRWVSEQEAGGAGGFPHAPPAPQTSIISRCGGLTLNGKKWHTYIYIYIYIAFRQTQKHACDKPVQP